MTVQEIQELGIPCQCLPEGKVSEQFFQNSPFFFIHPCIICLCFPSQIYMGDEVYADIERIKNIETTTFDFNERLSAMRIAVYPEDYAQGTLDPAKIGKQASTTLNKGTTQQQFVPITKLHTLVMSSKFKVQHDLSISFNVFLNNSSQSI